MTRPLVHRPVGRWSSPFTRDEAGDGERRWPAQGMPALVSPEPPAVAFDYAALRAMAETMLRSRQERFPGEVAAGQLDQEEAARELLAFENLVQTWRFIADGEGSPADHGADHVLRDALEEAIVRIASYAAEHGGLTPSLAARAEAVIALRWHLEPGRQTVAIARLNRDIRAATIPQPTEGENDAQRRP